MKKQILLCLLVATIILTGCSKEDTPTPTKIDPSAFVGKWIGPIIATIDNQQTTGMDTIILAINPNDSTQLINTYFNNIPNLNYDKPKIIYKLTDSKNYTVVDFTINGRIDGNNFMATQTNSKGVLIYPTTIRETGNVTYNFVQLNSIVKATYIVTYTKQ